MALKGTTVSLSLSILATFLLLSTIAAAAGSRKRPVSWFCKSAGDKALCTKMAKGAKKWPDAMTNMFTAAIERAMARKAIAYGVGQKLPADLLPQSKKSIDSTCKEAFDTLIFNLDKCREFVRDDPTSAMRFYLSSLTISDCTTALEEFGVSLPEVNEFDDELIAMTANLMAVYEKKQ